ncbi:uncharacterized protein AMSG_04677 [Thecamonas trahens ATCC 50062]|uniref:Uncharacterized protein n=1 Tax=Thecamonas trahens ATCC 50062 TaxID=461836 RepID=A0A0L0D971_THETB|nr:hypothetical protein AMSG_04677 [Thecamonas trahens ATCC 50062]KNC48932.1 hypothetical protein AMSG_04677 [Thecamonas trahens ATCC 50062]|eukprot:XP_013758349.1 hypothetical protein AMSG_04677 [Thecamonas trahens ATCC 50062]
MFEPLAAEVALRVPAYAEWQRARLYARLAGQRIVRELVIAEGARMWDAGAGALRSHPPRVVNAHAARFVVAGIGATPAGAVLAELADNLRRVMVAAPCSAHIFVNPRAALHITLALLSSPDEPFPLGSTEAVAAEAAALAAAGARSALDGLVLELHDVVIDAAGVVLALWRPVTGSPEALRRALAQAAGRPLPHKQPTYIVHSSLARIVGWPTVADVGDLDRKVQLAELAAAGAAARAWLAEMRPASVVVAPRELLYCDEMTYKSAMVPGNECVVL